MKVLCVIDWPEPGSWLWDYLPSHHDQVDFHITKPARDLFAGYGKFLSYYPHYLWSSLKALSKLKDYDIVVAYHGKNGVPLALLRSALGQHKPKLVILNFSIRGPIARFPWILRFAMSRVDCVTYPSRGEMVHSNGILHMPEDRIRIVPPAYVPSEYVDRYFSTSTSSGGDGGYIFASGRSFRDYATLMEAVRGLDVKLIVNTRPFCIEGLDIPGNVHVNDMLPMDEYFRLLANAKFVVVPLQDVSHGSGESHVGQTMAAGKAMIVTENPSTADLIERGITGLVVKSGDVQGMRDAIIYFIDHPDEVSRMGENAYRLYQEKYTFSRYAQRVVSLLRELCEVAEK
ncbi:MAG: glycosyltransferase family 4 protein [Chloroflexota bacterium]|nr:glycosyltransferase family 4 protein [Chloroflexota bacterium]